MLDHLLGLLAVHGGFDVRLEIDPGAAISRPTRPGRALGRALVEPLRAGRRHGTAVVPADEALAHVVARGVGPPAARLERRPLRRAGRRSGHGHRGAVPRGLTEGAELTLHVRLLEGRDTQHVLDAIFKALGIALAQACRPRSRKE